MVRDLFRNKETTEFVIATIPTILGMNESARLLGALRHDGIPCNRIIVNQVSALLSRRKGIPSSACLPLLMCCKSAERIVLDVLTLP